MTNNSRLPSSSVVGYLRVSTADQDLEKNKADILQLANNHDLGRVRFVEEKISGKSPGETESLPRCSVRYSQMMQS
jgi:DNA invertase Pin-like site-specific DNA recombinase